MKLDFNSLKFKNWIVLISFSIFILFFSWILQIVFLNNYYEMMREQEITKTGNEIIKNYNNRDFIEEIAYKNNVIINIYEEFDDDTIKVTTFSALDRDYEYEHFKPQRRINLKEFDILKIKLLSSNKKNTVFIDNINGRRSIIFGSIIYKDFGKLEYLSITSPLPPVNETARVLKNQLILSSSLILLLSIILSQFISNKLSKPIVKITNAAKYLAKGDFDVKFDVFDYTEVKELSNALTYATYELSKLDSYRKDFIANISHDLKTPLTIIKVYSEMIKDISGEDKQKRSKHCDLIINEVDRLNTLVNEILEMSKIQSGNIILRKDKLNLSQLLIKTIKKFEIFSEKEGYIFISNIQKDLFVYADVELIQRVLYNLISNAINYTGYDKKVIINLKENNRICRFEVQDTGNGIKHSEINNIWERYYKSSDSHKRSIVGTGLGLPIVKSIFKAHNINFGVDSQINKGSTFWFKIDILDQ